MKDFLSRFVWIIIFCAGGLCIGLTNIGYGGRVGYSHFREVVRKLLTTIIQTENPIEGAPFELLSVFLFVGSAVGVVFLVVFLVYALVKRIGSIARVKQWQAAGKERRAERLTTTAGDITEDKQYDLLFLHQRGFVRAKGSGQSITKVYADVENLIRKKLSVVVTPGTYFVSAGGHQNMATTTEYRFTLYPCSTEHLIFNAVCINANRPIPGKGDRFYGVARVSDNVARFLEASKNEDPMVIQAGVWALTDNYSRYDVIHHLISRDNLGNTRHPVTDDHCNKAKEILELLGIPHRL